MSGCHQTAVNPATLNVPVPVILKKKREQRRKNWCIDLKVPEEYTYRQLVYIGHAAENLAWSAPSPLLHPRRGSSRKTKTT